ncbi:MAG: hypothetical protein U9N30_05790 [Campylobacterota bacterium]|nr:hypothetical protein [Campylobacterota bacterium]
MLYFRMLNKLFLPLPLHLFLYFFTALSFALAIDISMVDDGLRHISYAAHMPVMNNWGEIFPHSLFTAYDPWKTWHVFLQFLLSFIPFDIIHVVINTLSLFFLMLLLDIFIRKYIKYNFYSFIYLLVFCLIYLSSSRYLMLRPDLLSGLFVMGALLLKNRFFPIFILTIVYSPFYYLFFLYTGSMGLVYMIQKKWFAFTGVFLGSLIIGILFLMHDAQGYIQTIIHILTDQTLRMGLEVGEGRALFEIFSHMSYLVLLPLFFGFSAILIYKYYTYFYTNSLALFLLITSILWVNQVRYFSLFFPLILVYIISIVFNSNKKVLTQTIRKYFILLKRYTNFSKKVPLFYLIAIPYTIAVFTFTFHEKSQNEEIEEATFFKNSIFNNKTILLNTLSTDIYKALYNNPTLHFVPSCSVGWFDNKNKKMKDIYIRMQKEHGIDENELLSLIQYVNADFYIHYLRNKKQALDFDKLKNLGIIPEIIYHNRIIFKINKPLGKNYD